MTKVRVEIDASTFIEPIGRLAETMAQQVKRYGPQQRGGPEGLHEAVFMSIRQARYTYNFLYFVHSDDIRSHYGWRREYTFSCAPLVRTLIDDLYNISALLDDPQANRSFHMTGFRSESLMFERGEKKYAGIPEWDEYIRTTREKFDRVLRHFGYTESEVRALKPEARWPTLGTYINRPPRTPLKDFLETFSLGPWKVYSAIAHGSAEGLREIGMFLNRDGHIHDDREKVDEAHPRVMTDHLMRAALVMLSICTEVQCAYRFEAEGARVGGRIYECWDHIMNWTEAKEVYDGRYAALLQKQGIKRG